MVPVVAQEPAVKGEEAAWPLAAELLRQQTLPGGGEMLCVQQLLVKGLFQPDTLLLTVQVGLVPTHCREKTRAWVHTREADVIA